MPKARVAPSIGELERSFEEAWGLGTYNPQTDKNEPTVFIGVYSLNDFNVLRNHKGKKWIFWCGSDIRHFHVGYWLDDIGDIKLDSLSLAEWINKECESWVENEVEYHALKEIGIESNICPSFLGDVDEYKVSYTHSDKPKVYGSVSGDDFELYKWNEIMQLADKNQDIDFHLYGNTKPFTYLQSETPLKNVFIHGRVSKEQMNKEIKEMQGALRLLPFDGFSEIIAKSLLWGQWPVSLIEYPHTIKPENIGLLKLAKEPNYKGREWLLETVNRFPWVK